jgi:hypothetical protein
VNINLYIERLILDGLSTADGRQDFLQAAVVSELTSLIREQGIGGELLAVGARPSIAVQSIKLESGYSSVQLGRQVAQSIYGGLSK